MNTGKLMNVRIEHNSGRIYDIWTDQSADVILRKFEGVEWIGAMGNHKFSMFLDPRYDAAVVIENVRAALEAAEKGETK